MLLLLLLDLLLCLATPASEHVLIHLLLSLFVLDAKTILCEGNVRIHHGLVKLRYFIYFGKRHYAIFLFAAIGEVNLLISVIDDYIGSIHQLWVLFAFEFGIFNQDLGLFKVEYIVIRHTFVTISNGTFIKLCLWIVSEIIEP